MIDSVTTKRIKILESCNNLTSQEFYQFFLPYLPQNLQTECYRISMISESSNSTIQEEVEFQNIDDSTFTNEGYIHTPLRLTQKERSMFKFINGLMTSINYESRIDGVHEKLLTTVGSQKLQLNRRLLKTQIDITNCVFKAILSIYDKNDKLNQPTYNELISRIKEQNDLPELSVKKYVQILLNDWDGYHLKNPEFSKLRKFDSKDLKFKLNLSEVDLTDINLSVFPLSEDQEKIIREVFEIVRRYKRLNPEIENASYSICLMLMQDLTKPEVVSSLKFTLDKPVQTVWTLLVSPWEVRNVESPANKDTQETINKKRAHHFLQNPLLPIASNMIIPKVNENINELVKQKELAKNKLIQEYTKQSYLNFAGSMEPTPLNKDEVTRIIVSLGDISNCKVLGKESIEKIQQMFIEYIGSSDADISIKQGIGNSKFDHCSERQYTFVNQTLALWKSILENIHILTALAEQDLLDASIPYKLIDSGQGCQRLSKAPRTEKIMKSIVQQCVSHYDNWIGSTRIHLGDHNVPNALLFLDKYCRIPKIINPLLTLLQNLLKLTSHKSSDLKPPEKMVLHFCKRYGGVKGMIKEILIDFAKHAFDGSGADNFYDAGSCVDGRLTSLWEWCSSIQIKSYYPIFLLMEFPGFTS